MKQNEQNEKKTIPKTNTDGMVEVYRAQFTPQQIQTKQQNGANPY